MSVRQSLIANLALLAKYKEEVAELKKKQTAVEERAKKQMKTLRKTEMECAGHKFTLVNQSGYRLSVPSENALELKAALKKLLPEERHPIERCLRESTWESSYITVRLKKRN